MGSGSSQIQSDGVEENLGSFGLGSPMNIDKVQRDQRLATERAKRMMGLEEQAQPKQANLRMSYQPQRIKHPPAAQRRNTFNLGNKVSGPTNNNKALLPESTGLDVNPLSASKQAQTKSKSSNLLSAKQVSQPSQPSQQQGSEQQSNPNSVGSLTDSLDSKNFRKEEIELLQQLRKLDKNRIANLLTILESGSVADQQAENPPPKTEAIHRTSSEMNRSSTVSTRSSSRSSVLETAKLLKASGGAPSLLDLGFNNSNSNRTSDSSARTSEHDSPLIARRSLNKNTRNNLMILHRHNNQEQLQNQLQHYRETGEIFDHQYDPEYSVSGHSPSTTCIQNYEESAYLPDNMQFYRDNNHSTFVYGDFEINDRGIVNAPGRPFISPTPSPRSVSIYSQTETPMFDTSMRDSEFSRLVDQYGFVSRSSAHGDRPSFLGSRLRGSVGSRNSLTSNRASNSARRSSSVRRSSSIRTSSSLRSSGHSNRGSIGSNRGSIGSNRGSIGSNRGSIGSNRGSQGSNRGSLQRRGPHTRSPSTVGTPMSGSSSSSSSGSLRDIRDNRHLKQGAVLPESSNTSSQQPVPRAKKAQSFTTNRTSLFDHNQQTHRRASSFTSIRNSSMRKTLKGSAPYDTISLGQIPESELEPQTPQGRVGIKSVDNKWNFSNDSSVVDKIEAAIAGNYDPNSTSRLNQSARRRIRRRQAQVGFTIKASDVLPIVSLGSGQSGTVWKALYRPKYKIIALKSSLIYDKTQMKQMVGELTALELSSPHLVSCLGAYVDGGSLRIALEYMDRGTLEKVIEERGPLPEDVLAIITKQLVTGLHYLHSNSKLHCDIKPANILVNSEGHCKLSDFGMMMQREEDRKKKRALAGTQRFLSPERLFHRCSPSFASDIWALGLSLVYFATGCIPVPFNYWKLRARLEEDRPIELAHNAEWSDEYRDFISLCLKFNPMERATTAQLLDHPFIALIDLDTPACASEHLRCRVRASADDRMEPYDVPDDVPKYSWPPDDDDADEEDLNLILYELVRRYQRHREKKKIKMSEREILRAHFKILTEISEDVNVSIERVIVKFLHLIRERLSNPNQLLPSKDGTLEESSQHMDENPQQHSNGLSAPLTEDQASAPIQNSSDHYHLGERHFGSSTDSQPSPLSTTSSQSTPDGHPSLQPSRRPVGLSPLVIPSTDNKASKSAQAKGVPKLNLNLAGIRLDSNSTNNNRRKLFDTGGSPSSGGIVRLGRDEPPTLNPLRTSSRPQSLYTRTRSPSNGITMLGKDEPLGGRQQRALSASVTPSSWKQPTPSETAPSSTNSLSSVSSASSSKKPQASSTPSSLMQPFSGAFGSPSKVPTASTTAPSSRSTISPLFPETSTSSLQSSRSIPRTPSSSSSIKLDYSIDGRLRKERVPSNPNNGNRKSAPMTLSRNRNASRNRKISISIPNHRKPALQRARTASISLHTPSNSSKAQRNKFSNATFDRVSTSTMLSNPVGILSSRESDNSPRSISSSSNLSRSDDTRRQSISNSSTSISRPRLSTSGNKAGSGESSLVRVPTTFAAVNVPSKKRFGRNSRRPSSFIAPQKV